MMSEGTAVLKMLAPFVKSEDGRTLIVLSDTSVDRQNERIAPELIRKWAEIDALPALVDHRHSIDSIVAVWKNIRAVEIGGNVALVAEPDWLDDEYAQKVRKKVEQLVKKGLRVGVSIGAVPKESRLREDGVREWVDAELVEASFVAIPANRNAGVWQASYDTAVAVVKSLTGVEKASPTVVALIVDAMKELKGLKEFVNNSVEDQTVREGVATIVNRILRTLAVARDKLVGKEAEEMVEKAASTVQVTRRPWTAPKQSEREKLPRWVFLDPDRLKYPVFEWRHLLNGGKERILNCNAVRVAMAYAAMHGHRTVYAKARRLWERYCAKKAGKAEVPEVAKESVPVEEVDDYVEDFVCPECGDFEDFVDEWDESILAVEEGDDVVEEERAVVEEVVEEREEGQEAVEETAVEEPKAEDRPEEKDIGAEVLGVLREVLERLERLEAAIKSEDRDAQKGVVPVVEKSDTHVLVYKPVKVR